MTRNGFHRYFRILRSYTCGTALSCTVFAAAASANLVTNGSFENIDGATTNYFVNYPSANLPGWSGGGYVNDCIVVAASTNVGMCGQYSNPIYDLQVSPGDSPDGGNYFLMDGSPGTHTELYQTLSGLTIGDDYQLTFYQAAGQLYPYDTAENDNWIVYFGDQTQTSAIMSTPGAGVYPWEAQTMNFVADSTSAVLGFLAQSSPINTPPILFLDGVSVSDQGPAAAPEPSTFAMLFTGLLAIPAARRFVRSRRP